MVDINSAIVINQTSLPFVDGYCPVLGVSTNFTLSKTNSREYCSFVDTLLIFIWWVVMCVAWSRIYIWFAEGVRDSPNWSWTRRYIVPLWWLHPMTPQPSLAAESILIESDDFFLYLSKEKQMSVSLSPLHISLFELSESKVLCSVIIRGKLSMSVLFLSNSALLR